MVDAGCPGAWDSVKSVQRAQCRRWHRWQEDPPKEAREPRPQNTGVNEL